MRLERTHKLRHTKNVNFVGLMRTYIDLNPYCSQFFLPFKSSPDFPSALTLPATLSLFSKMQLIPKLESAGLYGILELRPQVLLVVCIDGLAVVKVVQPEIHAQRNGFQTACEHLNEKQRINLLKRLSQGAFDLRMPP